MIGHIDKARESLRRIGGDIGFTVVDCGGVGSLVSEPCVDNVRRPLKRAELRKREFALVHVLAFLLVLVCASILPHDALAMTTDIGDGLDVDGASFRDAARIVYPYTYDGNDPDQVYEVLTDYLGFDWWALSTSVRETLKTNGSGDNPFALAAKNNVQNMQYGSWKVGWLDIETHPITWLRITQLMGTYGMDALWLVDMTSEYKEQVTRYFLNWTLPRVQGSDDIGTDAIPQEMTMYRYNDNAAAETIIFKSSSVHTVPDGYKSVCILSSSSSGITLPGSQCELTYYTFDPLKVKCELREGSVYLYSLTGDSVSVSLSFEYGNTTSENNYLTWTRMHGGGRNLVVAVSGTQIPVRGSNNISWTPVGYYVYPKSIDEYTPTPDPPTPAPEEPSDPTYEPPAADTPATWPTIHLPDFNFPDISISIPTIQYDGTDYTQWLKQIDDDIRSYGHDILYGISDFYDAFGDFSEDTSVLLADISRTLQAMGNEWTSHCDHITDEIYDGFYGLKTYIGSQAKYIVGTIKSETKAFRSDIVKWLKLIYNRLKGRSTTQPSIDDDEPGFWDWIGDILNGIINKLFDGLPDELKELIQDFEELTSYFPVSIPWDIAAVLGLFAHEPVTPAFPIDWVGSETYGIELHVVIDLSPWDEYAQLFRQILFVAFVVGMIFYTMEQIDIFGIITSKVGK